MDINGKREDVYAIGWCLATLTDSYYSKKPGKNLNESQCLKITLTSNLATFNFLKKERYVNTLNLIESLINT